MWIITLANLYSENTIHSTNRLFCALKYSSVHIFHAFMASQSCKFQEVLVLTTFLMYCSSGDDPDPGMHTQSVTIW